MLLTQIETKIQMKYVLDHKRNLNEHQTAGIPYITIQ